MMQAASGAGFPIVLTADRILMADYAVLFDGMLAAAQTTRTPGLVMRGLVAPPMPARDLRAVRAPLGLRRLEAALLRDGFTPADVAIVSPRDLHRAVGPATRLVGVSSGDPLGLGMNDSTVEGIAGGRVYAARWFGRLMGLLRRLRRRHAFHVVFGGPGAWQLLLQPETQADLGIDTIVQGYAESDVADLVRRALAGQDLPPVVQGRAVEAAAIPAIRGPSGMGAVEVSRGCGRGCDFCTVADVRPIHLPVEAVVADVETNVRGGARSVCLLGEDFFRYGAGEGVAHPPPGVIHAPPRAGAPQAGAVVDLARSVRRVEGLRLVQLDHAGVSAVVQLEPAALRAVREALTDGVRHECVWVNLGVETASGELLAANGGRAKMAPLRPDQWPAACEEAARRLSEAGFLPMLSLILGLPGERPDDVERTLQFVERLADRQVLMVPIFHAPVRPGERGFGVRDMTAAHWRLFRRSYALNFRWMPRLHWDNRRGAGAPLTRTLLLQAGGRLQSLRWKSRMAVKSWRRRR